MTDLSMAQELREHVSYYVRYRKIAVLIKNFTAGETWIVPRSANVFAPVGDGTHYQVLYHGPICSHATEQKGFVSAVVLLVFLCDLHMHCSLHFLKIICTTTCTSLYIIVHQR